VSFFKQLKVVNAATTQKGPKQLLSLLAVDKPGHQPVLIAYVTLKLIVHLRRGAQNGKVDIHYQLLVRSLDVAIVQGGHDEVVHALDACLTVTVSSQERLCPVCAVQLVSLRQGLVDGIVEPDGQLQLFRFFSDFLYAVKVGKHGINVIDGMVEPVLL